MWGLRAGWGVWRVAGGVLGLAGGSEGPGERSRVLSEGLVDPLRGLWGQLSGLGRRTENIETETDRCTDRWADRWQISPFYRTAKTHYHSNTE